MGALVSVIAAILLHGLAQSDVQLPLTAPWMLPVGVGLPYAFSTASQRAVTRGDLKRGRMHAILAESAGWVWFGVMLLAFGWLETVRNVTGAHLALDGWPEFALLLSFAPFLVYQCASIDAAIRAHGGSLVVQRHLRSFQLRMFAACVVPIAVFIAASALLGTSPWLRAQVEHVGLASALFTGVMVVLLAQLLPMLLRWSWDTTPFPEGHQRELLESVEEKTGFQPRDVRMWRTGDLMANAAIVGFGKRGRTVLFSDHLLSILNPRELCAVYAHEIGHAQRRHVTVFLAWTAGFVFLGDAATRATFDAAGIYVAALVIALSAFSWYVTFGWLSRRYELDADLYSLETVRDLPALTGALERVGGRDRERPGWRHFSVARRIHFLARAAGDPRFVRAFQRRLRRFGIASIVLVAVGSVVQLVALLRALPEDRAVASLARGNYPLAKELAQDLDSASAPELRRLAAAAEAIDGPSIPAATEALDRAIRNGEIDRAIDVARVAALRGVPSAAEVATALEFARDGDRGAARSALDNVRDSWRPLLAEVFSGSFEGQPNE